ncbi:MAG: hypothetical protein M3250_08410, partial [Thermoproteota archaeon]|nr:hypothetical protein [Thermoproteota archaeon]
MTTTDQNTASEIENLGWDDLVALKRQLSGRIKELSDKIIDIERNKIPSVNNTIHVNKNDLNMLLQRIREIRSEIQSNNSQLFSVSEKISQSKNFLSMMESRTPVEGETHLFDSLNMLQKILNEKQFKSAREKNDVLSLVKETSMKIEALKAIRTITDQMKQFDKESQKITASLGVLDEEQRALQRKIPEVKNIIEGHFNLKSQLAATREDYLKEYNEDLLKLEKINGRLDYMA